MSKETGFESTKKVALQWGVSVRLIQSWCKRRVIECRRVGGRWSIRWPQSPPQLN